MDNTENIITAVEWFAGYAGNSLGLRQVVPNMRDIAFCEREGFACANLVAKMEQGLLDAAPIWSDCRTFPCEEFHGLVDIFIASYPCQPFSAAGKRAGAKDERHLWPYVRQFVQRARPRYVFLENVEGHITLGLSTVISDLAEDGYTTAWGIFSASEVGAPHQRKRVFILAYSGNEGLQGSEWAGTHAQQGEAAHWPASKCGSISWPARPGEQQYEWEPTRVVLNADSIEPTMGRNINGPTDRLDIPGLPGECNTELAEISGWKTRHTNRIDEVRMCGNGVVPQTAVKAFVTLYNELIGGHND